MSNERTIITIIIIILLCPVFLQKSLAQDANTNQAAKTSEIKSPPDDPCKSVKLMTQDYEFAEIIRERDIMFARIVELKEKIRNLKVELKEAFTKEEIDKAIAQIKKGELQSKGRSGVDGGLETFDPSQKSKEETQAEINAQEKLLREQLIESRCMDLAISSFKTPVQDFKMKMSMIFAGLIGVVIVGFFVVAWKDEIIRRAVFSNQTGIQLLTLFSIVIAIILFGITGILHDKELAALLGGLSGYILGRYSSPEASPPAT